MKTLKMMLLCALLCIMMPYMTLYDLYKEYKFYCK